ncbi:hypothetical protein ABW21_db0209277 [Orbilia brochopaga]|nr:hypothetical protein ABW21_db0209277 [Drechslerella brochopaga]
MDSRVQKEVKPILATLSDWDLRVCLIEEWSLIRVLEAFKPGKPRPWDQQEAQVKCANHPIEPEAVAELKGALNNLSDWDFMLCEILMWTLPQILDYNVGKSNDTQQQGSGSTSQDQANTCGLGGLISVSLSRVERERRERPIAITQIQARKTVGRREEKVSHPTLSGRVTKREQASRRPRPATKVAGNMDDLVSLFESFDHGLYE